MAGAFPAPTRNGVDRRQAALSGADAGLSRADRDAAAASSAFERCIERLEETVEQETAALRSRAAADLREFNNRKSQGLLELSRSARHFQAAPPSNAVLARLASLREKLDVNKAVLKMHLDAVREVTTVMADAIRDADSDGTYSLSVRGVQHSYD
jgi:hypothetical protein